MATSALQDLSHFAKGASSWDTRSRTIVELNQHVAAGVQERMTLGPNTSLSDFGCGTGLLAESLAEKVGYIVGVDATAEMIAEFQKKIDTSANLKGKAVAKHLFLERADQLDRKFDLVCSTETFHHLPDPKGIMKILLETLKPGGRIFIAEFEEGPKSARFHPRFVVHNNVFFHGFPRGKLAGWLKEVGFVDVKEEPLYNLTKEVEGDDGPEPKQTLTFEVFLAQGTRPN